MPSPLPPERVLASFVGRTINHFTDRAGVVGIVGELAAALLPGQAVVADQARFSAGANLHHARAPGDIFVTDLPIDASPRQLAQVGIFGPKQEFVISMGEGQLVRQGVRIIWTMPELGIGTVPAHTVVQGPVVVSRR